MRKKNKPEACLQICFLIHVSSPLPQLFPRLPAHTVASIRFEFFCYIEFLSSKDLHLKFHNLHNKGKGIKLNECVCS